MLASRSQAYLQWPGVGLLVLLALPAGAQTVALAPAADTYLRSGGANQNQGSDTALRIQASGKNRALLHFDQAANRGGEALFPRSSRRTCQRTATSEANAAPRRPARRLP